ncbi:MAG: immune inhibitor A, partial [Pyrinomonadaceae bacterium]|nr:immune inhibitor A [Pyrinomonadaceae bacterium]
MSNRKSSLRFVSTVIAIIAISAVAYASPWTQALSYLGISTGGSAEDAASVTANAVMTPGTCDTAGPIEVEGSILGTTPTAYPTLGAAFSAINAGAHTGAITIDVCGNTDETTVSAVLNASGSGAASYTSITMSPVGGAARTITGAPAGGTPMIDLNGADNVTINGLNTGGNSLTISNTTVSATSGTSTIRFQADATGNTITNTSILGSSTMSTTTNGGNIWFGAGAISTGNDNNIISNNNIGPAGTNLPTKLIYGNGSTTTTAVYNSGIQITGNNLFDYFNAAAQSNAVYLAGGNTGWTISNNRIYQTATRTQTTGAILAGIQLASSTGNDGHTINGNTIGFANPAGTGTTNFVGISTSSKFLGIYVSSAATTTPSSIQGNTIAGINLSGIVGGTGTTSSFVGISIGSGVSNVGNITGNTVGSLTAAGSVSITNNNASASEIFGIYYFPSAVANVSNNNVGGIVSNNSGAGSVIFYGIRAFTSSTVTNTMQNNAVGSSVAPISNISASTSSRTIGLYCQSGACVVTGNTIGNLSMSAPNIGTGSSASMIGLWIDNSGATIGNSVSQNTVRSIVNNDGAGAVWVTGMQYNGATTGTHVVDRNFIHSISAPNTTSSTATINGINVQGGLTTYRNNMVAVGSDMTANSPQINGINETIAGTDNFYHNSVYVGGTGVAAGSANSFAFQSSITLNTRSYRDNIFFNARSNGAATGKHYAIQVGGTASAPAGLTSDNNLLFANGTGGFVGRFNAIDQTNLSDWKTATGVDSNSFAGNPQFNDPTNATPDLHLHPTLATVAEGNGVDVGVTNDFDGQTRASLTPVDIGADAGNFSGVDLSPPSISYTGLGNTSVTTNRPLNVVITDVTGTATGGNAPRVYFNKNAGSYFSTACSLSSGTVQSGQWLCTIDNSLLGGVVTADVVRYFVVAQDTLGNLGATPSGGFTGTNVNTVITPPTTPNQYTIVTAFTGSFNIGTGETYTSLTNTGGIFEAINAGALTGNVILNITTDLLAETGTVALNQWAEDGVGGYTLTIKPSGAPRQIVGTNTGALVRFSGTDRVTIDGSTTGGTATGVGGNAALRELTIQNTNTGTSAAVIAFASGTNGAQNNTVRNTNILGQDPTTTLIAIAFGGNTTGTVGTDNDGNRVENCSVKRAIYGIYSAGLSAANQNTGTVITRNDLSSTTTDRVRRVGIVIFNDDGAQITENSIATETNESADAIGIGAGIQGVDTTTVVSGAVTNALVARNKINGIASLSTTGFSAVGIAVAGGTTGPNTIVNNMITGVTAPSTSPDIPAGIFVAGVAGSSTRVYNNSVSMTGDRGSVATQTPGFGIAITGVDPIVELKNNIFYTTQISSGGGVNAKSYAIGMVTTTFANLDSNYNDFWSTGANDGGFRSGSLTTASGLDYADITAWRTAISDDLNSLESDPTYVDPLNNLHLIAASPMTDVGTTIASVTNDFDGDLRFAPYEIGADEFPDVTNPDTQILTTPSDPSNSADATFTFTGTDALVGGNAIASYECQIDGGGFSACTSPKTYTGLSQGSHTFQVRAKDGAGNVDPTPASFTWTIDAIAPDTTILSTPTNPSNSSSASFTFSGTDSAIAAIASFECKIDGGSFATCTSPQNYTGLADGSHTFMVRSVDTVGNVDPTPASYTWVVDTVAPTASLDTLPPNPSNSTSATFAFSAIDPAPASGVAGFECQLDAGAFAACTSPVNLTGLSQGSHTFTVKATDAAGNTSVPTFFTWSVDAVAPDTQILTNPPDPSASSSATFTFSGTDSAMAAVASFECKLDGGSFGACTSPKNYAGLINGSHTFEVRAVDGVGNVDPSPASYTWTVNVGPTPTPTPQTTVYQNEIEPNGTAATATVVTTPARIKGYVYQNGDIDYYAFPATAGDKVYSAVMTSASANASSDSQLRLYASDGTTEIEFDEDDGSLGGLSSTIAGATIPSTGTYYLRVNHFSATNQLRPYELYIRLQSGGPTPETESNDTPATANTLPSGGWVSGVRSPAVATEQDWYAMTLNAGDTVYLGLDLDPERDNVQWNGRLGLALFGDAGNQILVVDDGSTGSVANPLSEAFFFTVKTSGTYYAFVDSASAATGGPTATYNLSVTVFPKIEEGVNCTTYTSTNVPQTIGPGTGLVSSTITIPGNPRIADLDVSLNLTHALMADVDAHLRSPAGNDIGLFTDIGAAATGGQTQMDLILDDEAGLTPAFTVLKGIQIKPELAYSLSWFDGENAGGTWTLDLRDDGANASGGTLNGWSIKVCEQPAAVSETVVFGTDFESGAAGFTSSGTANEWEIGLPATVATTTTNPIAAFNSCNSGVSCWKTDLDNTYDVSSSQDLLSPNINLTGVSAPISLKWAQQFQMENASFDHARVIVQQVGNPASAKIVWEWTGATMTDAVGNPTVNIGTTAGWGNYRADISSFAGQNIEVIFHVDSDTTVNMGGLAIDDVAVVATDTTAPDTQILTNPTNPSNSADATFTFTGTDSAIA